MPFVMYVCEKMYGHSVCTVNHRDGTVCARPHAVPPGVLWFGNVDNRGDFWSDLIQQRKAFRKKLRKWQRDLNSLKSIRPAPAFGEYMRKAIASHHDQKPLVSFKPETKRYRDR